MVTRLPGTLGKACELIGSTVSSLDPVGSLLEHSGATTVEIASIASGSALAIRNAQARPAMTARWNGRGWVRPSDRSNVADIAICPPLSFRGDATHRTRNLEIPDLVLTHHPGMTASVYPVPSSNALRRAT